MADPRIMGISWRLLANKRRRGERGRWSMKELRYLPAEGLYPTAQRQRDGLTRDRSTAMSARLATSSARGACAGPYARWHQASGLHQPSVPGDTCGADRVCGAAPTLLKI
jgi:hypothetical protein